MKARRSSLAVAATVLVAGCAQLLGGLDDPRERLADGGAAADAAVDPDVVGPPGLDGATGGDGAADAGPTCDPGGCASSGTECEPRRCSSAQCLASFAEAGAPCGTTSGTVCDGKGACIGCNDSFAPCGSASNTPICESSTQICRKCAGDGECATNPGGPACQPEGRCAQCSATNVTECGGGVCCAGACKDWLAGFSHRVAVPISNAGASVDDYQVRFAFGTAGPIAAGRMTAGGADIRVTASDKKTVIPFVIQSGINTGVTTVWTRVPTIPSGNSAIYVYYGNPGAPAAGSATDTFVDLFVDPRFQGLGGWSQAGPSNGGSGAAQNPGGCGGGCAYLGLSRGPNPNGSAIGLCQSTTFPAGTSYRLIFDAEISSLANGIAYVTRGGLNAIPLWASRTLGLQSNLDSGDVPPGPTTICFEASVEGSSSSQSMGVYYRNVRVRRFVAPEPAAGAAGPESAQCP